MENYILRTKEKDITINCYRELDNKDIQVLDKLKNEKIINELSKYNYDDYELSLMLEIVLDTLNIKQVLNLTDDLLAPKRNKKDIKEGVIIRYDFEAYNDINNLDDDEKEEYERILALDPDKFYVERYNDYQEYTLENAIDFFMDILYYKELGAMNNFTFDYLERALQYYK